MYWLSQLKESLKAKPVWHDMQGDRAMSSYKSHHDGLDMTDSTIGDVMYDDYAPDVACSEIFQGLGQVPVAYVSHLDCPWRFWKVLHQQESANTTFSNVVVHPTLAPVQYIRPAVQKYVPRTEHMSAQLDLLDAAINKELFVAMLTESFGDRSTSPFGPASPGC